MMFSAKHLFIAALAALAFAQDDAGGGGDAGGDAGADAGGDNGTVVTMTKVVSEIVTYCPEPTVICIGIIPCITVDKPTMLTITDCPCTVTEVATLGPENPEPVATGAADSNQAAHGLAMAAFAAVGYLAL